LEGLTLPHVAAGQWPVWHLFVVCHAQRDMLAKRLAEQGVATMIHYPVAPHLQPAYASLGLGAESLPISEAMHAHVLSLPMGPTQTDAQTQAVIDAVRRVVAALASEPALAA
jgi:dTDP-4-amino-4,6-dideoxygalactose transaminase